MKIVMTFEATDDANLVQMMIDHHIRQGIDEFLVTDSGTSEEVSSMLKEGVATGVVRLLNGAVSSQDSNINAVWVLTAEMGDFWLARDRSQTLRQILIEQPATTASMRVPVIELGGLSVADTALETERRIDAPAADRHTGTRPSEAVPSATIEVAHLTWQRETRRHERLTAERESLRLELERVRARKSVRVADSVQRSLIRSFSLQRRLLARLVAFPHAIALHGQTSLSRRKALRMNVVRLREVRRLLRRKLPPRIVSGTPSVTAVPVIMCLWNRPERLDGMLTSFARQSTDKDLRVILWNNALADSDYYAANASNFPLDGALSSIELFSNDVNIGGMARFVVARMLWEQGIRGPFIMVDDDQDLNETFIEDSLHDFESHSITAWWAFRNHGSHWSRSELTPGETADYGGTGGTAVDLAIVEDRDFFSIPVRYFMLEDQWMSHYAKNRGWKIRKSSAQITAVLEETNQYHALRELKDEFFGYLNP